MASSHSHSDRSKSTWVHGPDHELRPLSICEKERLTGMQLGDTQAYGVRDSSRHRMCGNAFPVGWVASILHTAITTHISPPGLGLACASHGFNLYTQASRLQARHSLHVRNPASIVEQSHGPSCAELIETSTPQAFTMMPSLLDRIRTATQADSQYQQHLEVPPSQYAKHLGLLFQQPRPTEANFGPAVLIVPNDAALRQDLLHLIHDRCHFGQARTWAELHRHFYWPRCKRHCTLFVQQCPTCQLQKPGTRSRYQDLFPEARFYPHPFHTIVRDVVEGFPFSKQGHNAVITVVDKFPKFAIYIPIHTSWSATRQAALLLDHVVYRYHCPTRIHTNNRPMYRKLFDAFCTALGTQHITGTPYHSQSEGGAERQHRTLLTSLRTMCNDKREWDDTLQATAHGYNDSVHDVLIYASFELLYGCRSRLPWHLQFPSVGDITPITTLVPSLDARVSNLLEKQRTVYG
eukprot:scaffold2678_cov356-Pavlova_lutheri.AAC.4